MKFKGQYSGPSDGILLVMEPDHKFMIINIMCMSGHDCLRNVASKEYIV